jgi:formate C-acetyltransferase
VQGRDERGLTAMLMSLSRLPHHLAAASSSAIIEVDPVLLEGEGRTRFVDLIQAAIRQGVGQMQWNVVSAETLRKAQANPQAYRSLCVRVSGFSQQFILLDKEMQEHIIARTKHRR